MRWSPILQRGLTTTARDVASTGDSRRLVRLHLIGNSVRKGKQGDLRFVLRSRKASEKAVGGEPSTGSLTRGDAVASSPANEHVEKGAQIEQGNALSKATNRRLVGAKICDHARADVRDGRPVGQWAFRTYSSHEKRPVEQWAFRTYSSHEGRPVKVMEYLEKPEPGRTANDSKSLVRRVKDLVRRLKSTDYRVKDGSEEGGLTIDQLESGGPPVKHEPTTQEQRASTTSCQPLELASTTDDQPLGLASTTQEQRASTTSCQQLELASTTNGQPLGLASTTQEQRASTTSRQPLELASMKNDQPLELASTTNYQPLSLESRHAISSSPETQDINSFQEMDLAGLKRVRDNLIESLSNGDNTAVLQPTTSPPTGIFKLNRQVLGTFRRTQGNRGPGQFTKQFENTIHKVVPKRPVKTKFATGRKYVLYLKVDRHDVSRLEAPKRILEDADGSEVEAEQSYVPFKPALDDEDVFEELDLEELKRAIDELTGVLPEGGSTPHQLYTHVESRDEMSTYSPM